MICPRCDHEAGGSAKFCDQCGSILSFEDPTYALAAAYRLELAGKTTEAVEEYERLLETGLDGGGQKGVACIRKHLGNLHFRLGHLRRAKTHLAEACKLDPKNAAFWHDLGVVQYHTTDFDAAEESMRNALKWDPNFQLAYFWLGNAVYHSGDYETAKRAFSELLDRYPNFAIARFHLGVIYSREGNKDAARKEFDSILLKNPDDAVVRFYVGGGA